LITYYFGSKQKLWTATVNHLFAELTSKVQHIDFDQHGKAAPQVRGLLYGALNGGGEGRLLRTIFTQEYFEDSERYHKVLEQRIEAFMRTSTELFRRVHALWPDPLLSMREMQLLFNGILAATSVMPYEIASLARRPIEHPQSIALRAELLLSLFSSRALKNTSRRSPRSSRKSARAVKARSKPLSPVNAQSGIADAPAKLMEASIDVFARHGFHGSSLRAIAERAGISFQLIRYHFGSKEALWAATLTHLLDQRCAAMRASHEDAAAKADPEERLRSWLTQVIAFALQGPQLRKLLAWEYFSNSGQYTRIVMPKIDEFQRVLLGVYEQMIETGTISGVSAREAALLVGAVANSNVIMPYEVQLTVGAAVTDPRSIEFQVNLLYKVLTRRP
jgi:TetR/AcrR family transcriptional regulator